jgi:ubiquitin C-terminal hydrolase
MEEGNNGLKNRGNTCYLNTVLQSLIKLKLFTNYFLSNSYINDLNNRFKHMKNNEDINQIILSKEYGKLINAMSTSSSPIEPKTFHELIQKFDDRYAGFEHQDSQEVLSLIIDYLHEGLKYDIEMSFSGKVENEVDQLVLESFKIWKRDLNNKYSIVTELFYGQFVNEIWSSNNSKKKLLSRTFEIFNILNIPIYGKTLYDSLSKYFSKEILESPYLDENTGEYVKAYRTTKLMKIPQYMIIVLKRFTNTLNKLTDCISFPIDNLELDNYVEGYEKNGFYMRLISIGCHRGLLNGGHYYAICRNSNNLWYKYDDETVSPMNIENISNLFKDVYILIYEKTIL